MGFGEEENQAPPVNRRRTLFTDAVDLGTPSNSDFSGDEDESSPELKRRRARAGARLQNRTKKKRKKHICKARRGGRVIWSIVEEKALKDGIAKYGKPEDYKKKYIQGSHEGIWHKIKNDQRFRSKLSKRTGQQLKDKYRNMRKAGKI